MIPVGRNPGTHMASLGRPVTFRHALGTSHAAICYIDHRTIIRNDMKISYYGITLRNHITESHCRKQLGDHITELYYDQEHDHISTKLQRQKLSIGASNSLLHNAPPKSFPSEARDLPDSPEESLECTQATCQATSSSILDKHFMIC